MLIPFRSKAAADFFMLQTNAMPLFELMGKPLTAQGVISANDVAHCLANLQKGLADVKINPQVADNNAADGTAVQSVGLKQRAWPLMDMLERANKKQVDVLWGVAT